MKDRVKIKSRMQAKSIEYFDQLGGLSGVVSHLDNAVSAETSLADTILLAKLFFY